MTMDILSKKFGKRRALLVGVNKYKMGCDLRGCVNDINELEKILYEQFCFDAIRKLLDADATTANIKDGLHWLKLESTRKDVGKFGDSSHGSNVEDLSEPDHLSEVLCPYDFDWSPEHMITDKFMYNYLEDFPGIFYAAFDACHSGDALRNIAAPRFIPNPALKPNLTKTAFPRPEHRGILMSGCRADQTSADACIDDRWCGAFSHFRNKVWKAHDYKIANWRLIDETVKLLKKNNFSQEPQLDCLPEFTVHERFQFPE